ncbi:hypothetical protein, conserved [Trypanosoma brucei gambiense DAL972]|uniref:Uncharacterized protein n=2 Tax=Trypanosoma brucei TaxID=5691 RepID=C9ZQF0_TRYB9|nr:hypothetical protein, conserved [Trypanosoma brucei gambiense DAL972]6HIX_BN Chain BN, ml80 [Trypanosoma brucei brucei]6YXX_BN Chain BN, mL80 [Trypanosoma brucei brucei]6YXY_BN Chain BN, mL80 [Trypanosoma brucei brucei]CBH11630.1 hypothetical protein, conserved [Trypanosoma brucei gambiense DAL972]|eukprot:XP_011773915.1 hypothetical protein, conserved [Trypanosoma brucei gambiense DAL972]
MCCLYTSDVFFWSSLVVSPLPRIVRCVSAPQIRSIPCGSGDFSVMKRSLIARWQSGVHTPHGVVYRGAKMKNWPEQRIPENFKFTEEQRFRTKAIPRDVGTIPRNFVLGVLYRHQPCEVGGLWEHCTNDPEIVLDSKRHLREVLKQAREEGFVTFERDAISNEWLCFLTRERYEEVQRIVTAKSEAVDTHSGLRGAAATETSTYAEKFREMNVEAKEAHARRLEEEVANTTRYLRRFQQREIDYLPYTDLNGKVNFMWWYETRDVQQRADEVLTDSSSSKALAGEEEHKAGSQLEATTASTS